MDIVLFHRSKTIATYRRGVLSLFWMLFVSLPCNAFYPQIQLPDTTRTFIGKILFPKASAVVSRDFAGNHLHIDSIGSFLASSEKRNFLSVKVIGSYSPEGRYAFNTRLAKARASAMADIVKGLNPSLDPVTSVSHPVRGKDFKQQRFAELQVVYRNVRENITASDTISPVEENAVQESQPESIVDEVNADGGTTLAAEPTESISLPHGVQSIGNRLFLTTNMLYDAALVPNIGVGMSVTDRITVMADWMCAWWSNRDKRRYWRIYGGDIEARYRIGKRSGHSPLAGHHVGVYCSMACYDFQTGRSHEGVLSDKYNYAMGVSYTYSMPVATRLNIDFSLGIGYLWGTYKKHMPIDDCDVWLSTHKMGWFGPTRAGVSLVWLIGNSITNSRKGGGR